MNKKNLIKSLMIMGMVGVASAASIVSITDKAVEISAGAVTNIPCTTDSVSYYIDGPSSVTVTDISKLDETIASSYKIKKTTTPCSGGYLLGLDSGTTETVTGTITATNTSGKSYKLSYSDLATKTITVNVVPDTAAPVIETTLSTTGVVANVNDAPTADSLLAQFTAVDAVDGQVSVYWKDNSGTNYETNRTKTGTYTLTVGAKDASGNEATYSFNVVIKDVDAPVISGPESFTSNMSSPITETTIRSQMSVSDNYDSDLEITLKNDSFTGNEQTKGTYTITYSAVDSSENVAVDKIVTVYVVDDIAPVINVPNDTITVSASKNLSWEETLEEVTVTDNVDGNLTASIVKSEDTYANNRYFLGTYKRVIQVADSSGNIAQATINIKVVDLDAPVIYVQNRLLAIDVVLTEEQLASAIAQVNNISYQAYSFTTNDYLGNEAVEGTYATAITFALDNDETMVVETEVVVKTSETEKEPAKVEKEEKFYKTQEFANAVMIGGAALLSLVAIIAILSSNKKVKKGGRK